MENEYDLSINKYKEIEYVPVEYPPTEEIMADIYQPEKEIKKNLDELSEMLKRIINSYLPYKTLLKRHSSFLII